MRSPNDLELLNIPPITIAGGMRVDVDSTQLEANQSPYSANFIHRNGKLSIRPGLSEFGAISSSIASTRRDGAYTGVYEFTFENGARHLAACNYDASSSKGSFHTYNGSTWTDRSGATWPGSAIIESGGDLIPFDFAFGLDGEIGGDGTLFFVNDDKYVYYWNSASGTPDAHCVKLVSHGSWAGPGGITNLGSRFVEVFGGCLILAYTKEDTATHTTRVRRSTISEFATFDTTAGASVYDLAETPGAITGMWRLGEYLFIAKTDAIVIGRETGDPDSPLAFPDYLSVGCLEGRSFAKTSSDVGFFLGPDNVYAISSSGETTAIGNSIISDIFANLNFKRTRQIFGVVDETLGLYRLFVPIGSNDHCTRAYVYNYREGTWFVEQYSNDLHAATTSRVGTGTLISTLTSTIATYTNIIADWGADTQPPTLVFACKHTTSDFRLYKQSAVTQDRMASTANVFPFWASKDFRLNEAGTAMLRTVSVYYNCNVDDFYLTVVSNTNRNNSVVGSVTKLLPTGNGLRIDFHFRSLGDYHRVLLFTANNIGANFDILQIELRFSIRGTRR